MILHYKLKKKNQDGQKELIIPQYTRKRANCFPEKSMNLVESDDQ